MKTENAVIISSCVIIVLGIILINIQLDNNEDIKCENSKVYFKNFHLKLTGKVIDIISIDHGAGMLRVNVIESSIKSYDVRYSDDKYFCVINQNKAELVAVDVLGVLIDDSIMVDTDKDEFKVFRQNKLINQMGVSVNYPPYFFRAFKKLHKP